MLRLIKLNVLVLLCEAVCHCVCSFSPVELIEEEEEEEEEEGEESRANQML